MTYITQTSNVTLIIKNEIVAKDIFTQISITKIGNEIEPILY